MPEEKEPFKKPIMNKTIDPIIIRFCFRLAWRWILFDDFNLEEYIPKISVKNPKLNVVYWLGKMRTTFAPTITPGIPNNIINSGINIPFF